MTVAPLGPAPSTRAQAERALATRLGSPIEARWVVTHVLGDGPSTSPVDAAAWASLTALVDRRLAGEPLQYVLGTWAFRTLELTVDRRALIPRPETEQVVEAALHELRRLRELRRLGEPDRLGAPGRPGEWEPVVVDLGTGTGAIGLSIAVEAGALVWATDADADALALAAANRDRVTAVEPRLAGRVTLAAGDWFAAVPAELAGRIDLVVSNPPYVAAAEWPDLSGEVRREPHRALVAAAGSDGTPGLAAVEAVLVGAAAWLARPGAVVVELAPHQADAAVDVARRAGFVDVDVARDLAGRDRAVVGRI
jgi:release factor glutamine methyltransferase